MTTEERVIAQVAETNPVPDSASPTAQDRAEAERVLRRVLGDAGTACRRGAGRPATGDCSPRSCRCWWSSSSPAWSCGPAAPSTTRRRRRAGGLHITLKAEPTPQRHADHRRRDVPGGRAHAPAAGIAGARLYGAARSGADGIVVTGPRSAEPERARIVRLVTQRAQLRFYDWEANVLTPTASPRRRSSPPRTAAPFGEPGAGDGGAGVPGAGSMPLYDAVKLAAKQPSRLSVRDPHGPGPVLHVRGARQRGCAAAFRLLGCGEADPGVHCLLAGPLEPGSRRPSAGESRSRRAAARRHRGRGPGRWPSRRAPSSSRPTRLRRSAAPGPAHAAQFFVLHDDVALTGSRHHQPPGEHRPERLARRHLQLHRQGRVRLPASDRTVTHRGADVSLAGATLNQHFAVAVDGQLLTVPQIDFHQYPDGIIGGGGADITGGFTRRSAGDLATELRYGALPLAVRVVP